MDKYLGKRLDGRYEMRELIGVGDMAYVYKAYDCVDDRTVAVKILRDEYLSNEEFVRRRPLPYSTTPTSLRFWMWASESICSISSWSTLTVSP